MKEMEKVFKQMQKLFEATGENIKELTQSVNDIKRKQELRKKAASQSTSSSSSTKEPTTDGGSKKTNKRLHKSDSSEDSSISDEEIDTVLLRTNDAFNSYGQMQKLFNSVKGFIPGFGNTEQPSLINDEEGVSDQEDMDYENEDEDDL